jgi:hypothetical protein
MEDDDKSIVPQRIEFDGLPEVYHAMKMDLMPNGRHLSIDTADIVAIGAVILCIGEVLAALIVTLGFVFGKVQAKPAEDIILGCVGGSAVGGVIAGVLGRPSRKRKSKKPALKDL